VDDQLLSDIAKVAKALDGVPKDLRPVAFQFLLQRIPLQHAPTKDARKATPSTRARPKSPAGKAARRRGRPRVLSSLKIPKSELTKFYDEKKPQTHQERYAVMACFLQDGAISNNVDVDEIYTCYSLLNKRGPKSMDQVFRDADRWFERDEESRWALNHVGREYVRFDLPKKTSPPK